MAKKPKRPEPKKEEPKAEPKKEEPKPEPKSPKMAKKPKRPEPVKGDVNKGKKLQESKGLTAKTGMYEASTRKSNADTAHKQLRKAFDNDGVSAEERRAYVDEAVARLVDDGVNVPDVQQIRDEANALRMQRTKEKADATAKEVETVMAKSDKADAKVAENEAALDDLRGWGTEGENSPAVISQALTNVGLKPHEVNNANMKQVRKEINKIVESGDIAKEMTAKLESLGHNQERIDTAMKGLAIRDLNKLTQPEFEKLARKAGQIQKAEVIQLQKEAKELANKTSEKKVKAAEGKAKKAREAKDKAEKALKDYQKNLKSLVQDQGKVTSKQQEAVDNLQAKLDEHIANHEKAVKDAVRESEASKAAQKKTDEALTAEVAANEAARKLEGAATQRTQLRDMLRERFGTGKKKDKRIDNAVAKVMNGRVEPYADLNEPYRAAYDEYYSQVDRSKKAAALNAPERTQGVRDALRDKGAAEQFSGIEAFALNQTSPLEGIDVFVQNNADFRAVVKDMAPGKDKDMMNTLADARDFAAEQRAMWPNNPEMWLPTDFRRQLQSQMSDKVGGTFAGRVNNLMESTVFGSEKTGNVVHTMSTLKTLNDKGIDNSLYSKSESSPQAPVSEQGIPAPKERVAAVNEEGAKVVQEWKDAIDAVKAEEGPVITQEELDFIGQVSKEDAPKPEPKPEPKPKHKPKVDSVAKAKKEAAAKRKKEKEEKKAQQAAFNNEATRRTAQAVKDTNAVKESPGHVEAFEDMFQKHMGKKDGTDEDFTFDTQRELAEEIDEIRKAVAAQDPSKLTPLNMKTIGALDLDMHKYFVPDDFSTAKKPTNTDEIVDTVIEETGPVETGFEQGAALTEDAGMQTGESVTFDRNTPQGALGRATDDASIDIEREAARGSKPATVKKPTADQIEKINEKMMMGEKLNALQQKQLGQYPDLF